MIPGEEAGSFLALNIRAIHQRRLTLGKNTQMTLRAPTDGGESHLLSFFPSPQTRSVSVGR